MLLLLSVSLSKPKPKPICHGGLFLAKAWERYRFNDEVSAACYLREAICRFLVAWCERDGVKFAELDKRSANKLYKLWCKAARQKPCYLMTDVIKSCNQVVHLQPIECEFYVLLDLVRCMFEDEIDDFTNGRNGGAL
jgi:hypothetical protein